MLTVNSGPAVNKAILITGATGFLGSHLLRRLLQEKFGSLLITNYPDGTLSRLEDLLQQIHVIDLSRSCWMDDILNFKEEIGIVIHLATNYGRSVGAVGSGGSGASNACDEATMMKANVDFPLSVLKVAIQKGASFFINTDTSLPANVNLYSLSKKKFLEQLRNHTNEINVVNMVLEHFYGPNDGKFVSLMMRRLINKDPLIDLTDGCQRRDFIYYEDVINAYIAVLKHLFSRMDLKDSCQDGAVDSQHQQQSNIEFHIGSEKNCSIRELMDLMREVSRNTTTLLNWGALPRRENEVLVSQADLQQIKSIGWKPQYSLRRGIERMYEEMSR